MTSVENGPGVRPPLCVRFSSRNDLEGSLQAEGLYPLRNLSIRGQPFFLSVAGQFQQLGWFDA